MLNEKNFNRFATNVAKRLKVAKGDLFSTNRKQEVCDARHLLFWVSYKSGIAISYIQKYCDESGLEISHPAVIHGINKIDAMMNKDMEELIKTIHD